MNETNLETRLNVRTEILAFEQACREVNASMNLAEPDMPVTHHFAPGMYGREVFVPKGCVVVAKIHKHAHLAMLMQGRISVKTEFGNEELVAPKVMVSPAGIKRAVYTHEDTVFVTVHLTTSKNLDVIENEVIAATYEDFDNFQLESAKETVCLGSQ